MTYSDHLVRGNVFRRGEIVGLLMIYKDRLLHGNVKILRRVT